MNDGSPRTSIERDTSGLAFNAIPAVGATIETRVGRHIKPQPNGCWLYKGRRGKYQQVYFPTGGSRVLHRWIYEILVEPIPHSYQLHHICEERGCCNPAHLVPTLPSEHVTLHKSKVRPEPFIPRRTPRKPFPVWTPPVR